MLEQGKISYIQAFYLLVNLVAATAAIFLPAIVTQESGRNAWLAPVLATIPGIYLALVIGSLGKRYPGQTLIQYLQSALGTWPGRFAGAFYIFYFLHTNALIIREFGELMVGLLFPRTPLLVFHGVMLLLCAWAIRGGLEVLARTLEITVPLGIFLYTTMIVLTANKMDFNNLAPVLENGILPVIRGSLAPAGWWGEIILLAMFLPYMARPGEGRRCAILSVAVIGFILTYGAAANILMFGPETASRLTFPTFSLFRSISLAGFFERIESMAVAIWVMGLFGKIALFYYATVLGAAQLVNLKTYRPLVLPFGVLLVALSILVAANSGDLVAHIAKVWPIFAYVFEYIIPTGLLLAAVAFGAKRKKARG
jgi:spore germination protein KB